MKGRFIVLEGIDGCGKTTQLEHLVRWLPSTGLMSEGAQLLRTREPGGTSLGRSVRELLLHTAADEAPAPIAELLLYTADRSQHVETLIRPALERGDWVISDRFSGSTLAYQGYGRGLNRLLIDQLEQIATGGLQPDLTLLLELPLEESVRRRCGEAADRIEAEGQAFLGRVCEGFAEIVQHKGWFRVDAAGAPEGVFKSLEQVLLEQLGG